jgi:hypothetical protein
LLLLQSVAFLTMFRGESARREGIQIDMMEPFSPTAAGPSAIEEIFATVSSDRMAAARKVLAYLKGNQQPAGLIDAARRLIFLKGKDSHDYKFSSAVLEDYYHVSPAWRDRYLAASVFNLRGSAGPDNNLVRRTRAAFAA